MFYIEVVFAQEKVTQPNQLKKYSFLTETLVEVGDAFVTNDYNAPMQIVKVVNLDKLKKIIVSKPESEEVIVNKIEL